MATFHRGQRGSNCFAAAASAANKVGSCSHSITGLREAD